MKNFLWGCTQILANKTLEAKRLQTEKHTIVLNISYLELLNEYLVTE
jgi:hypothetical protein